MLKDQKPNEVFLSFLSLLQPLRDLEIQEVQENKKPQGICNVKANAIGH